jgi:hypothetical protein
MNIQVDPEEGILSDSEEDSQWSITQNDIFAC